MPSLISRGVRGVLVNSQKCTKPPLREPERPSWTVLMLAHEGMSNLIVKQQSTSLAFLTHFVCAMRYAMLQKPQSLPQSRVCLFGGVWDADEGQIDFLFAGHQVSAITEPVVPFVQFPTRNPLSTLGCVSYLALQPTESPLCSALPEALRKYRNNCYYKRPVSLSLNDKGTSFPHLSKHLCLCYAFLPDTITH